MNAFYATHVLAFCLFIYVYVTRANAVIRINHGNAALQQLITYCTLRWQFNYVSARCDMTTTLSSIMRYS